MQLIHRYGLSLGYPDGSFRGDSKVTRYETAALLAQVLRQLHNKPIQATDRQQLDALKVEFDNELLGLAERVDQLEDQSAQQSSVQLDLSEALKALQASLPFQVFGSLALRWCGMADEVLSAPDKIFSKNLLGNTIQSRFGGGIRGRSEAWDYELRMLSTDNQSYNLSWFPFGGSQIPRAAISLDRFFIRWQAIQAEGWQPELRLSLGKAPNFLPESQLLFDEDVSFTGMQQELRWLDPIPGWKSLSLELGQHALLIEGPMITAALLAAKASSEWEFGSQWQLRSAFSFSHYLGSDRLAPYQFNQGYLGDYSRRNRLTEQGDFSADFGLINAAIKLTWRPEGLPSVSVFGDLVHNLRAQDANTGWLAGFSLGQMQKPGDLAFSYSYRHMQQDYNLSLMVDDNFSGTDVAGHVMNLELQLAERTFLGATLITRQNVSNPLPSPLTIFYTGLRQDF
ncbi:MAG: hypothetical protein CVV27_01410 [Candidatus Melainabacteria bacterium HGW-Melainabacteria-1]|nr:MAG: hypothetical protein CVV27_01410 [Candidatus Melainabacteria bacterium HGW-Melainabacteria-1]